jgi:hypothetical protein
MTFVEFQDSLNHAVALEASEFLILLTHKNLRMQLIASGEVFLA